MAGDSAASDREAALLQLLEESRRELQAVLSADKERGAIHSKLKDRVEALKIRLRKRGAEFREIRRAFQKLSIKIRPVEMELEERKRLDAYGLMKLVQPGISSMVPPDAGLKHRIREAGRSASWVWRQSMRLGVLQQHEPKFPRHEKFPKHPVGRPLPLISVVTPSFNQASYLERTMRSVLSHQDDASLEYFVCDGGSNDGSVDVIRRHEQHLAGWISEKDSGPAEAINKGFQRSKGEIMAWLNSDDLWMQGVSAFVGDYFSRHEEVDVVYGHRIIIDEKDNEIGHWTLPPHDGQMLLWADYIPQETLFWRRRIWDRVGGSLDASFKFAFDWDLLLRFQRAGARIVRLPWFMGCFRAHAAQKSSAEIDTVGIREMARLRERELGTSFTAFRLERNVLRYQHRAVWCERLLRLGLRS